MNEPIPKRSAKITHAGRLLTITDKDEATVYVVDKMPVTQEGIESFALTKRDGTCYHVKKDQFGLKCDCPQGTYRNKKCRHVLALIVVGHIGATSHGYHEGESDETSGD